jgi:hypothetical protein
LQTARAARGCKTQSARIQNSDPYLDKMRPYDKQKRLQLFTTTPGVCFLENRHYAQLTNKSIIEIRNPQSKIQNLA